MGTAKIMGVHCDSDQATIVNKISTMEARDRKQVERLGDINHLP